MLKKKVYIITKIFEIIVYIIYIYIYKKGSNRTNTSKEYYFMIRFKDKIDKMII